MGPPETRIVGASQLVAPISSAGVVLSQPASSRTPSIGLARMVSSTSIAAKFRNIIVVGRMSRKPRLVTGNSGGNPPAMSTPRFERCDLRDVGSLQASIRSFSDACGGLDVLVNNAANDDRHAASSLSLEHWEDR